MYPTITDLIFDLTGFNIPLPIHSFGFFVACAFASSYYCFNLEIKRKIKDGILYDIETKKMFGKKVNQLTIIFIFILSFLVFYKLSYAILNYSQFVKKPQHVLFSLKGNIIWGIIGGIIYTFFYYKDAKKLELPKPELRTVIITPLEFGSNLIVVIIFSSFIGAKLFHNLENLDELIADPFGSLFSLSGISVYGGIISGYFFGSYYIKYYYKKNIAILHWFDTSATTILIGYCVGRLGCQIAGDGDWGIPNDEPIPNWLSFLPDWVWAYNYPNNVLGVDLKEYFINKGYTSITGKAFPTPLYETIMSGILFIFFWKIRKKIKYSGIPICIYLILNGIERLIIEGIRINEKYHIGNFSFSQAQLVSVLFIVFGIIGILYFNKKKIPIKKHEK